jgi:hypothetical protein
MPYQEPAFRRIVSPTSFLHAEAEPNSSMVRDVSFLIPAVCLLILFASLCTAQWRHLAKHEASAFSTYYDAASEIKERRSPYGILNAYPYIYPPLYAWACQPLTDLTFVTAERIMLLFDSVVMLASFVFCARAMLRLLGLRASATKTAWAAFFAAIILIGPVFREMHTEQVNGLILLGFVLSLYWLDQRPILAGLALALAISIKYLPLVVLPYLLLRRRWNAFISALLGWAFFTMLPATTLGWSVNLRYLSTAYGGLARAVGATPATDAARVHPLSDVLNISVTSSLARLASDMNWPHRSAALIAGVILGLWIASMLLMYRQLRLPVLNWPARSLQQAQPYQTLLAIEWGAMIVLVIAFSPNGELMLSALPVTMMAALLAAKEGTGTRLRALCIAVLFTFALLMPIANIGHANSTRWNAGALSCWILLAGYLFSTSIVMESSSSLHQNGNRYESAADRR